VEAYFYSNHNSQVFDSSSTPGRHLVGEVGDLPAGVYLVVAKADIGVNVATGYPPPAWTHGGGALTLTFGGSTDVSYTSVRPEDGVNHENVSLMAAAQTSSTDSAQLFFQAVYPLRTVVNSVRIAVLTVDALTPIRVGRAWEVGETDADSGAQLVQHALTDVSFIHMVSELIRRSDDD
jgi:hypothetical protein